MESGISTKEENKKEESVENDQQNLESRKFLEKTPPNFKETEETGNGKTLVTSFQIPEPDKEDATEEQTVIGSGISDSFVKGSKYENKVVAEIADLLEREHKVEESIKNDLEMSRIGVKSKLPNKPISRPSLPHTNDKLPGELSGQGSVKSVKEDIRYWKNREQELLDRIALLESKSEAENSTKEMCHGFQDEFQTQKYFEEVPNVIAKEKELYNTKHTQIVKEQKKQSKEPNLKCVKNSDDIINHLRTQNEDLRGALAKMTVILKDKTALCVTQEKKILALSNQVTSLKEVVAITKDLLNIRNMEVQHISNDISTMETKIDCERQRHNQMLVKMDEAVKLNNELKKEYENQMKLFQHLRDSYEEKIRLITHKNVSEEEKKMLLDQEDCQSGNSNVYQMGEN